MGMTTPRSIPLAEASKVAVASNRTCYGLALIMSDGRRGFALERPRLSPGCRQLNLHTHEPSRVLDRLCIAFIERPQTCTYPVYTVFSKERQGIVEAQMQQSV